MDNRIRPIGPLESAATAAGVALLAGFGAFGLLFLLGDWTFIQAVFGGAVVGAVLMLILLLTVGRADRTEAPQTSKSSIDGKEMPGASKDLSMLRPRNVNAPSPTKDAIPHSGISDTGGPELARAQVNKAKGEEVSVGLIGESGAAVASASASAAAAPVKAEPAPKPAPATPAKAATAAPAAETAKPAAPAAAAPAAEPAKTEAAPAEGPGTKPVTMDKPRAGKGDDLKKIKGIGPKLEKLCNSLGFWHFDQIAKWSADEVAWVDQNLEGFKGRVSRDEWVSQAKTLAEGGDTAFSQKVDKGGVY